MTIYQSIGDWLDSIKCQYPAGRYRYLVYTVTIIMLLCVNNINKP